ISSEGKITDVNDASVQATGVARESLIGTDFSDYFTEPEKARESYRRVFLEGFVRDYPLALRHASGRVIEVLYNATVYRDEQGQVLGVVAAARDISERKRAETAMRESEGKFRAIFDEAPLGVALINSLTGHIYEVNVKFAEIAGRARAEMATIDWMGITHPDDVQEDLDQMARLNAGEITGFHMNKRYRRPDGSYVWIHMTIAPITVANRTQPRHLCMIEDITERKQAEEKLRLAGIYNRSLLEASLDPLVTISSEGKITDVNEASVQATGVARENLIGTDFSDYFTDPAKARAGYHQVFREGFVRDYELELRSGIHQTTPVLYNATVYRTEKGEVIGVVAAARDITERKLAEQALQASEDRLLFALDEIETGAWDLNLIDHSSHRSLKHDQIFGYETRLPQWTYEIFLEHVLPEDRAQVDQNFRQAVDSKGDWHFECRIIRRDGQQRWILASGRHRHDPSGQSRRMAGIIQDITDRKRTDLALREISVALQHKNAELERFLYAASHDLKSPVVTVRTFLGYLEQDMAAGDAGRIASDVNFIRTAADKMARLLDDLLEMSRVGRVVGPPVRVTFRQLVDDALAAVAGQIAKRGVTVMVVGDGAVTVFGDRMRLAEVFQNLLDNACKFMGEQQAPRIEVGVEARDAESVFFVRDNGIGIDPRFQAKAFNLFEKLEPKTEGSGLGLALVKRIVELHGGRIWVESPGVGQGACFYFTLPGAVNPTNQGNQS
ncbi:PAS domain S-box protein, partial [bacterium]|nr:PAS domain S-box protein [bacterium]